MKPARVVSFVVALVMAASPVVGSAQGKSFLWRVQSGTGVLYLAGSIHALGADAYPLSAAYQKAFDASGALVEEINLSEASTLSMAPALLSKGMYRDGRTLDSVLSKDTAARVAARVKGTPFRYEMLRMMKPWMVMLMLTALQVQQAGLDPKLGLDQHFFDKAADVKMPVIALETAEYQIDRFDQMPDALQEQLLLSTLKDMDAQKQSVLTIVSAWKRGDAAQLETFLLDSFKQYPAAYDTLLVERNRNWMPQLEACLTRPSPCFVVVGAAHLIGSDGLLAMLRQKGYRVEQQ